MNINLIYDSSIGSAPSAFTTALTAVVQFLDATLTNPITINIDVSFGAIAGQSPLRAWPRRYRLPPSRLPRSGRLFAWW